MFGMATLSLDLRERILSAYDKGDGTRDQIARRFCVSEGMVKKLIQQRRHLGDIRPQHHRSGRKPKILATHRQAIRKNLAAKPDLTLEELRDAVGLECTIQALHYVLVDMGLTYKKRRSELASKTGTILSKPGGNGDGARTALIPIGSSSSTKAGRKPT
jgi:transposase